MKSLSVSWGAYLRAPTPTPSSRFFSVATTIKQSPRRAAFTSIHGHRRGGVNLSERISRIPRGSSTEAPYAAVNVSDLSAPGLAYAGSQNAASRLAREGEEYTLVGNVRIPTKPKAPAEDECCMSGCAVCVYDLYIEAKAAYANALSTALATLQEQDVPKKLWPIDVLALADKSDSKPDASAVFEEEGPLDATLKAFLELEKRLKGNA